mmetsp:Transcript_18208/g.31726  ORF Transcript_18208/g.31726 Transcript_18208/m.31726 type:complete len:252 (+) Transcript_18208:2123-2878(+)
MLNSGRGTHDQGMKYSCTPQKGCGRQPFAWYVARVGVQAKIYMVYSEVHEHLLVKPMLAGHDCPRRRGKQACSKAFTKPQTVSLNARGAGERRKGRMAITGRNKTPQHPSRSWPPKPKGGKKAAATVRDYNCPTTTRATQLQARRVPGTRGTWTGNPSTLPHDTAECIHKIYESAQLQTWHTLADTSFGAERDSFTSKIRGLLRWELGCLRRPHLRQRRWHRRRLQNYSHPSCPACHAHAAVSSPWRRLRI